MLRSEAPDFGVTELDGRVFGEAQKVCATIKQSPGSVERSSY
jgi:hypothetical protein